MTLPERYYKYLMSLGHGQKVSKKHLVRLALDKGWNTPHITRSLEGLDAIPEIGRFYQDGEVLYCWYSLTDAEKETYQRQLSFWNSL